jgi:large subunit ribosomal protein L23
MTPSDLLRRPVITEKATAARGAGVYAFAVAPGATKPDVKRAVEAAFKVKVRSVRTMNQPGKKKRLRTQRYGRRPDWKKAIVTLAPGEKIAFFEGL